MSAYETVAPHCLHCRSDRVSKVADYGSALGVFHCADCHAEQVLYAEDLS